jgi:hypothetical protein
MLVVGSLKKMDGCMSMSFEEDALDHDDCNGIFPKRQFVDERRQPNSKFRQVNQINAPRPDQTNTLEIIIVHNGS